MSISFILMKILISKNFLNTFGKKGIMQYIYQKNGRDIEFSKFAIKNSNVRTKKSSAIAQYIYANHVSEHLNSTYLLYGPPGTGKTTLISHLYNEHNCKILKIDATTITNLTNDSFYFITDLLMPDFIIIDDYDRLAESNIAKLLFFFEKLKSPKHNITTIITANDPSKLDRATLRSGRIDEVIEIGLPDEEERSDLVTKLIAEYKLDRSLTPSVIDATNGYCHADIIGLVGKLRYLPFEQATSNLSKLMKLSQGCTVKTYIF